MTLGELMEQLSKAYSVDPDMEVILVDGDDHVYELTVESYTIKVDGENILTIRLD